MVALLVASHGEGVPQEEVVPEGEFQQGGVPGNAQQGEGVPWEAHLVMGHEEVQVEEVPPGLVGHEEDLAQMAPVGSDEMAF